MEDEEKRAAPTRDERRRDVHHLDHADTEPAAIETAPSKMLDAGRRYELGAEIARGGMGRVLEATDTLLGRRVALKAALDGDPDAVRRFAREIRVTARLEHPSIVPVYDAGKTADGVPYYVMRKVAGRPLEALVHEGRTIDDRLALLPHVLAAVEAVAHAHGRGVLHRDLKPSNILVGELGETVVIDWGLAKVIDDPDGDLGDEDPDAGANESLRTRVGQVVGTPGFMAPEQLNGDLATRSCDVYALGGTLYHVLAGEPPHAARSSDEMIALALAGPPKPLADVTGVPRELVTIVERAMSYDERARYPDGAALAADLRRFLTGQLVAAHRYSPLERAIRFVKRYRAATAVALVAMIVVGVLAYVSITNIVRERNAADEARLLALHEKQAAESARIREAERADDLLLSRASSLVQTNPTIAVGLLRQLPPTSKIWLRARDVLAEARSRGVPWVLPASGFTTGLAITRNGKVAFSAGSDGVVRRHDLEAHVTRELHKGTPLLQLIDDKLLALAGEAPELVWLDVATGAPTRIALPRKIEQLAVAGTAAIFHDGHDLWLLARSAATPIKIEIAASKVFGLSASPDGTRVVVNAQPEAVVIELAPTPHVVVRRPARSMEPAWSADGKRLAIAQISGLDEIDFTAAPTTRSIATLPSVQAATYVGEDLYFTTGAQTTYRHHPRDGVVQIDLPAGIYSSATSTHDAAVFVGVNGLVTLASRGGTLALHGPVPRMFRASATPSAGRFLVVIPDHLLLYDDNLLLPRSHDVSLANTVFHGFAGNGHYLMGYMLDDWHRLDVATGTTTSLGNLEFGNHVASSPDGSYVIARKNRSEELVVMRPAQPPAPLLAITSAVALSPARAVVANEHDVQALDLATGTRTPLWSSLEPLGALLGNGTFIVAYARGTLWRYDDRTRTSATVGWASKPTALDVAGDGSVWIAADSAVWRWGADGTLAQVAHLTRPIVRITHVARVGCVAIDDRRNAMLIEDAEPVSHPLPAGYEFSFFAANAPLIAGLTHDRKVAIYDLETKYLWTIGAGEVIADIADDGRHIATYSEGQLSIYTLDLAVDRAAYERQLDAVTNLRVEVTGELLWPN